MLEFIKMFGLGLLYTILFPFFVVVFALYLVYTLGNYLVIEVYNCVSFFFGYTFTTETALEKKLNSMNEEKYGIVSVSQIRDNENVIEESQFSDGEDGDWQ